MENATHWCDNCPYGSFLGDRYFCIFTSGSCIYISHTMENPNSELKSGEDFKREYYKQKRRQSTTRGVYENSGCQP